MDYLMTWNCAHIANAALRNRIEAICGSRGYKTPIICTPEELLEDLKEQEKKGGRKIVSFSRTRKSRQKKTKG
jgi:hypothetical protein